MRDCIIEAGALAILGRMRRYANGAEIDIVTGRDARGAPVTRTRAAVYEAADRLQSAPPPRDGQYPAPAPEDVTAAVEAMVRAYERDAVARRAVQIAPETAADVAAEAAAEATNEAGALAGRAIGSDRPAPGALAKADSATADAMRHSGLHAGSAGAWRAAAVAWRAVARPGAGAVSGEDS